MISIVKLLFDQMCQKCYLGTTVFRERWDACKMLVRVFCNKLLLVHVATKSLLRMITAVLEGAVYS
jgi:hypothetical protein